MDTGLRLLVVLALVAANGFFVAAEFALVTARKTRIDALAAQGSWAAQAVRKAIENPNRFISACQLGITMASLALGWVGEETIAALLEHPLEVLVPLHLVGFTSHALAVPLAFAIITFMHITLGEQVPKMIALQKGEATAMFAVQPTNVIGTVFRPFIWLLSWFTEFVLRLIGIRWQAEHHQAYSVEDLKALIRSTRGTNGENTSEGIAERALDFSTLLARQVMVPRTEMVAVSADESLERLRELMLAHEHSRYPVYESSPDNIVGVLSAKHVAAVLLTPGIGDSAFDLRKHMSAPVFVPESMHAHRLLAELKLQRSHLAIVVDEYGATAGIVTLPDLLDRIAGEVPDESEAELPRIQRQTDGTFLVDGLTLLADLEDELHVDLTDRDYDTLGGFVFGRLGRRPTVGDSISVGGYAFTVEEVDGLRVAWVRVAAAGQSVAHPS